MPAPVTRILPCTTIRRKRLLPFPGKVLVRKGQKVAALDTIAESYGSVGTITPKIFILNIERALNVHRAQLSTINFYKCKTGDQVMKGDILAGPMGIAKRVLRAPEDGWIVLVDSNRILLEVKKPALELKAGFVGEVVELIPDYGAIIETTGTLIQGVWGNGGITSGTLIISLSTPDQEMTKEVFENTECLPHSLEDCVLLAGYCSEPKVLEALMALNPRGVIFTSLEPRLTSVADQLPFPVIILEGFGRHPINPLAYDLLTENEGRETALKAEVLRNCRPEIIISTTQSSSLNPLTEPGEFAAGQQVRIRCNPYFGSLGILVAYCGIENQLNGLRAPTAEVLLESGITIHLPLVNLEIIVSE